MSSVNLEKIYSSYYLQRKKIWTFSFMLLVMLLNFNHVNASHSLNSVENTDPSVNAIFDLACNDLVHISLDTQCQAIITIDMVTEGDGIDPCWVLEIYDENGDVIPNNRLTGDHLGSTLNLAVKDTCIINSCWGQIFVEDKYIPELECHDYLIRCADSMAPEALGFPVPNHLIVRPTNKKNTYTIDHWDSCGTITLSYYDTQINAFDCDFEYKTIIRRWRSEDESGNLRTCSETIDVHLPNLTQDVIALRDTVLWCDGGWPSLPNGHPSPAATGWPIPQNCNTIAATYTDQRLDVCGATFKVLRKWKLVDWCAHPGQINEKYPKLIIYYQIIKVLDDKAPELFCPTEKEVVGMDHYRCSGSYTLPIPLDVDVINNNSDPTKVYVVAECSSWEYRVRYVPATSPSDCTPDGSYGTIIGDWRTASDPAFTISDLPTGCNWFYYEVVDDCGNRSECGYSIEVVDNLEPVAVCDHHTSLTLNIDGKGKIYAETFDDGSYDNCMIDYFAVRRMDRGRPCGNRNNNFSEFVEFCCKDVGKTIMVEFIVVDKSNNRSLCMVEVVVNDKEKPELKAPSDLTVDCRFVYDIENLGDYFGVIADGKAAIKPIYLVNDPHYSKINDWLAGYDGYAYDNCGNYKLVETYTDDLHCGRGNITRTFTVTDQGGLVRTVKQIITFDDVHPFTESDIHWPKDVLDNPIQTDCINGVNTDPSTKTRVDSAYGARNLGCANITVNYKDDTLTGIQDACYKIIRTWTVIDWCQFHKAGDPIWEHRQFIKVANNNAPVFDAGVCDDRVVCDSTAYLRNGGCVGFIKLKPTATDDCTPDERLVWSYQLDLNSTGTFGPKINSDDASGRYHLGVHRIKWKVADVCGNVAECFYTFELKECKAPTPYCRNGLVTVVMPTTGTIAVWAKDLNIGSFDNCTEQENLTYAFSEDGTVTSITYTCDSLDGNAILEREVKMWVTDESGNKDFCITKIRIQDNGACGGNLTGSISGLIVKMDETEIEGTELELFEMGSNDLIENTQMDGQYTFHGLTLFKNYEVRAQNRHNYIEGVSTRDLVAIQKHLLGRKEFEYSWQFAAADANNSKTVSTADISSLRKLILGRVDELAKQDSWLLYDNQTDMDNKEQLMTDRNKMNVLDLSGLSSNNDYHGIKVGDVNGDINHPNANGKIETRNDEPVVLEGQIVNKNGHEILIVKAVDEMDMEGLQFTLDFAHNQIDIKEITSDKMHILESDYALHENAMTFAWNNSNKIQFSPGDEMFSVLFNRTGNDEESIEMEMNSSITRAIAVLSGDNDREVLLTLRDNESKEELAYKLWQNKPNPFDESTIISYQLPEAQEVHITFKDLTGRILKSMTIDAQRGYNELSISGKELKARGVIYYQLETAAFSATKKMLLID